MTRVIRAWGAAPLALLTLLNFPLPTHAQTPQSARNQSSGGSDLSPAQRARAEARQAQFRKDVLALRADAKLSDAQKQAKYGILMQAMDKDMLAILTPGQRTEVMQQRQIGAQFQKDVAALKADPKLTDAQKRMRYQALVQKADQDTLATLTPTQRAAALKRHQTQEEAQRLGQQLQKSETPAQSKKILDIAAKTRAQMQTVIADKTLSDPAKAQRVTDLRKQAQAKDLAVLTPAQRALYARIQALVSTATGH